MSFALFTRNSHGNRRGFSTDGLHGLLVRVANARLTVSCRVGNCGQVEPCEYVRRAILRFAEPFLDGGKARSGPTAMALTMVSFSPRGLPTFNNGDEANSFFQTLMSLWNNVARRFSAPHSQLQCRSLKLEILNIQAFRYPLRDEECR